MTKFILDALSKRISRLIFSKALVAVLLFLALPFSAGAASPFDITYNGRMVDTKGRPMKGPIGLLIEFYDAKTAGNLKGSSYSYSQVTLIDGVFQLTISLASSDYNAVFGSAGETWIQLTDTTHKKTYTRQMFFAVPYALKIPVDESSFDYNAAGQLTLKSDAPSGAQIVTALNASTSTINTTRLPALAGDVSGAPGANTVAKIQGTAVSVPSSSSDSGKFLQYNGTSFVLSSLAGSSGGTVTSITASAPLSATASTTIPALSISEASASTDGYLASADWTIFNGKQGALAAASSVASGYLVNADWISFNAKQGALGFSPLNRAGDTLSGTLFMGAQNELRFGSSDSSHYVSFKAPTTVTSNVTFSLPSADGAGGQILSTNGSGLLAWTSQTVAPVSSVAGRTGAITLSSSDVTEGSNLYYQDIRARGALFSAAPISYNNATGAIGISQAGSGAHGYLSSGDWSAFNAKQAALTAATGGSNGYLVSSDWISFNAKEPALSAGIASQYYRGDKSWQSLDSSAVTESSNLYFTVARAQGAISSIAPLAYVNGAISLLKAGTSTDGYLSAADWGAFNAKQPALGFGPLNSAGDTMSGALFMRAQNEVRFGSSDSSHYVGLKAPSTVTSDVTFTLPAADGAGGQILATNGSGLLSWTNQTVAPVISVAGRTGAITLSSSDVAEGANLYYSDARARGALLSTAPISYNNVTGAISINQSTSGAHGYLSSSDWSAFNGKQAALTVATDGSNGYLASADWISFNAKEPAVSAGTTAQYYRGDKSWQSLDIGAITGLTAALNLKADGSSLAGKENSITAGTSGQYWRGDKSWQTLDSSVVTENANLYFTTARAQSAISASAPLAYSNGVISLLQSGTSADGYLSAADWGAFNGKQAALGFSPLNSAGDTMSGTLFMGGQELRFGSSDLSHYVGLKAPITVTVSVSWILPAADGTAGQLLATNGSGGLSWTNLGVNPVSSVAGRTGDVTLSSSDVAEGSNLYYSDARARAALTFITPISYNNATGTIGISQSTSSGHGYLSSTDWSAFNGKQAALTAATGASNGYLSSSDWISFNAKEPAISAGTSSQYWRGDKSWQSLTTAVVSEGTNLYYSDARARVALSASAPLAYSNSTGAFSLAKATGAADGYLSSGDWIAFNAGSSQWTTSGSNIYRSAGNVGIGTTTPTSQLDVHTATNINSLFGVGVSDTTALQFAAVNDANSAYVPLEFNSSKTNFRIGNVGIGTTAPAAPLEVVGAGTASVAKFGSTFPIYLTANDPGIGFNAYYDGAATRYGVGSSSQYGGYIGFGRNTGAFNFYMAPAGNAGAIVSLVSSMTIAQTGNVGIGTATPGRQLHVAGNPGAGVGEGIRIQHTGTSGASFSLLTTDSTDANPGSFAIKDETAALNRIQISSTGNVGIGTAAPSTSLQVNGAISAANFSSGLSLLVKTGNNGSVTCNNFCNSSFWGGFAGACVAARRTDTNAFIDCNQILGTSEVCLCAVF